MAARHVLVALAAALAACGGPAAPTLTTGLTGVVVRGPITPVCQVQTPCEAPFAAMFSVNQNGREISQFASDANGRFTVHLQPGTYTVVPGPTAPILAPQSQVKSVQVLSSGLTEVRLEFDTGIR
ncbi:MAG TPA: hypothetical protein VN085_09740 [Vicinamibacterales bacterium]|jgi:hypothetical protein|nr:hypothetical protein [Vicinamibacterales bacterium]